VRTSCHDSTYGERTYGARFPRRAWRSPGLRTPRLRSQAVTLARAALQHRSGVAVHGTPAQGVRRAAQQHTRRLQQRERARICVHIFLGMARRANFVRKVSAQPSKRARLAHNAAGDGVRRLPQLQRLHRSKHANAVA
jgi:hypothetical protein